MNNVNYTVYNLVQDLEKLKVILDKAKYDDNEIANIQTLCHHMDLKVEKMSQGEILKITEIFRQAKILLTNVLETLNDQTGSTSEKISTLLMIYERSSFDPESLKSQLVQIQTNEKKEKPISTKK